MTSQETINPEAKPVKDTVGIRINQLTFEHLKDAFGIGTAEPRLSWIVETEFNRVAAERIMRSKHISQMGSSLEGQGGSNPLNQCSYPGRFRRSSPARA